MTITLNGYRFKASAEYYHDIFKKFISDRNRLNDWNTFLHRGSFNSKKFRQSTGLKEYDYTAVPECAEIYEVMINNLEKSRIIKGLGTVLSEKEKKELTDLSNRLKKAVLISGKPAPSMTELSFSNPGLYNKIVKHPHKIKIFMAAGIPVPPKYWSDEALIGKCAEYSSLSNLKNGKNGNTLHKEIKKRGLEDCVVSKYAWYNYGYIGLNERMFRSKVEMLVGNLFTHNNIDFIYDKTIPGSGPLRYDFYLSDFNLYIEVLQNTFDAKDIKNKRRMSYALRNITKETVYDDLGLNVIYLNSDPFSCHSHEIEFIKYVVQMLKGVCTLEIPPLNVLCFNSRLDLVNQPFEKLKRKYLSGVKGWAEFQNRHSTLFHLCKARPDYDQIESYLRKKGERSKSENISRTKKKNFRLMKQQKAVQIQPRR